MEEKKSAVDTIYDMHEMIVSMQKKMEVLEKNNALLTDLVLKAGIAGGAPIPIARAKPLVVPDSATAPPSVQGVLPTPVSPGPSISLPKKDESDGMVKVFGIIVDALGIGQRNTMVSHVDPATGQPIKTTKTNPLGEWSMVIPPGAHTFLANINGSIHKVAKVRLVAGVKEMRVDFK